jgi:hypothetical protein
MTRKTAAAATLIGLALTGLAAAPASAAVDPDCTTAGTVVHLTGKGVPVDKVRIFGLATATLTVDVPAACTDPYVIQVPRLGVSLTLAGGDATVTAAVSDSLLSNTDAGVPVAGSLTYQENVLVAPATGASAAFSVTPLRYTRWTATDAFSEAGFTAGDTITAKGQLSVADWDTDAMVAYGGRLTRLVVRDSAAPWPPIGAGTLVRGSAAGESRASRTLGTVEDTTTVTKVLRYTYSGNSVAAPSAARGDAVKVAADES